MRSDRSSSNSRRRLRSSNCNWRIYQAIRQVSGFNDYNFLGEVPPHLMRLKVELEKTFANLEKKNELLINSMAKNFGKTQ